MRNENGKREGELAKQGARAYWKQAIVFGSTNCNFI